MSNQVIGDLLCLILDLNPVKWSQSTSLSLDVALNQILIFANSHLAIRHENQIALFAATQGRAQQLYSTQLPPIDDEDRFSRTNNTNIYQQFRIVDELVTDRIKKLVKETSNDEGEKKSVNLVGALSMALCHINRLNLSSSSSSTTASSSSSSSNSQSKSSETSNIRVQPRILILSVTQDAPNSYVPIMNCIFTAQKSNIQIDVVKVLGKDAVFLQQASHLTSGTYYRLPSSSPKSSLLQYLLCNFLSGPLGSKHLNRAKQDEVDLRAACFCHRKIVDIGFVCSVCLSIFCSPLPVCTTCRTKFPMSTLKRLGFGSRPKPPGGGGIASTNGNGTKKRKAPAANGGGGVRPSPAPPSSAGVSRSATPANVG